MVRIAATFIPLLISFSTLCLAADGAGLPDVQWVRPSGNSGDKPVWGIRGGIAVGIAPTDGPRGLIRVYTPYLDQRDGRIMNFIAVEPIVDGERSLSEIEHSAADNAMGKRMVSLDSFDAANVPTSASAPARGVIGREGDVQTLRLYVAVERFDTGARPVIEISFRSDRPHEMTLRTFAATDSATMQTCVLTATMGNFARLRHLQLKDRTIDATTLFAGEPQEGWGFYPWHEWPADQLQQRDGVATVSATGDADAPGGDKDVPLGWRYEGHQATQSWSTPVRPGLRARANGRSTFWATKAAIPGGAAIENLELMTPFMPGEQFTFKIEPAAK